MKVLISGGTGMIGKALTSELLKDGHDVMVLTRHPERARQTTRVTAIGWDGKTANGWGERMNEVDVVVNLVGERLSNWPWTMTQKQRFWDSRVNGGRVLVEAIRRATKRPRVFIQASGINYYGPRGSEIITEADRAGEDLLADLCKAWEESTMEVEEMGVRRAITRSGIVLNPKDGILPIMMLPVKLFVGGRLGGGRQGLPWIHQEDEVRAIRFLMDNEDARGAFNLTVPKPISSAEFMRTLARVMKRPYWLPVPGWALRLVLGGMAALVLDGMYPLPERLQALGFRFQYESAEAALQDLVKK